MEFRETTCGLDTFVQGQDLTICQCLIRWSKTSPVTKDFVSCLQTKRRHQTITEQLLTLRLSHWTPYGLKMEGMKPGNDLAQSRTKPRLRLPYWKCFWVDLETG